MADVKWSSFTDVGSTESGDIIVGLRSGANVRFNAGTAASLAASDSTQTDVASVKGTIISGHVAVFADTSGTVQDGGALPGSSPWTAGSGTDSAIGGDGTAVASTSYSLAYGNNTTKSSGGVNNFAFGNGVIAEGAGYNFAFGNGSTAGLNGGSYSFCFGQGNLVRFEYGLAFGLNCTSAGNYAWAIGNGSSANNPGSVVWGDHNSNPNSDSAQDQFILTFNGGYKLYCGSTLVFSSLSTGSSIIGTNTNDNAAPGYVGEYISSTVLAGSAVSLTSTVVANITSIPLTSGDWDVSGNVCTTAGASTVTSELAGWISTTSATFPTAPNNGALFNDFPNSAGGTESYYPVGTIRISVPASTTVTVYLSVDTNFSVSTLAAFGFIGARRVR